MKTRSFRIFENSVTYPEFWRSPVEMPHLQRETRHPHSGDAVIHYWKSIISLRDEDLPHPQSYLPQRMPRLPLEMRHLYGRSLNLGICDTAENSIFVGEK
jgi:hypothetical protein